MLEKVDEKKAPRLEGGSEKEKEKEVEQTLELSEGEAEDDKDGGAAGNGQLHDVGEVAEQVLHEFALPRPKESDLDSVDDGMVILYTGSVVQAPARLFALGPIKKVRIQFRSAAEWAGSIAVVQGGPRRYFCTLRGKWLDPNRVVGALGLVDVVEVVYPQRVPGGGFGGTV